MRTTRALAATAALVVAGSAFAAPTADNGAGSSPSFSSQGNFRSFAYDSSGPADDFGFPSGSTYNSGINLGGAFAPGHPGDNGTIWVLTGLSYELPSTSNTTVELGFGWYGIGGGINFYPNGGHHGLMISARVGFDGGGVAANAAVNYVGHFSPSLMWRLGVGVEYVNSTNAWWLSNQTFPFIEADLGFRL
jgi:hypothetical protein